jgi:hypothetical protein
MRREGERKMKASEWMVYHVLRQRKCSSGDGLRELDRGDSQVMMEKSLVHHTPTSAETCKGCEYCR